MTATPGTDEAQPAWIIRSRLAIAGDEAAKARWCNERNAALLIDPQSPNETIRIGGWGLSPEGSAA